MMTSPSTCFHLGLIGWPLERSRSPLLHTAALRALNLPGEYQLYPVPTDTESERSLADLIDLVRRGELTGLNVTIPYKQRVIPMLDELTPSARNIGAVNTICRRGEWTIGDNTDAPGFMAALGRLMDSDTRPRGNKALVLGAGGAGHAVVYALADAGWQVFVTDCRMEQTENLVSDLRNTSKSITAMEFQPSTFAADYSLIVNTTPVGMILNDNASPWPDGIPFPKGALVFDLVYKPVETVLVRSARAAGLRADSGLGMLLEQAALSFEIWSGQKVPRQILWDALNSEQEKP